MSYTQNNQFGNNYMNFGPQARSISTFRDKLLELIKKHPQSYKIFLSSESEADQLAKEIDAVLLEAGWIKNGFIYNLGGFYPDGITFEVKQVDPCTQSIADLFHSNGLKISGNQNPKVEQFTVFIGPNR